MADLYVSKTDKGGRHTQATLSLFLVNYLSGHSIKCLVLVHDIEKAFSVGGTFPAIGLAQ